MAWTLVTPSSRGIGAALTRRLLQTTPASIPVVATARSDIEGVREKLLSGLDISESQKSRLDVQKCDVLDDSSMSGLSDYCMDRYNDKSKDKTAHLRLGLIIPGMLIPEKAPDKIEYDGALETLKLNLLAPMMLLRYFSPMLPRKAAKLESIEGLPAASVLGLMSARVGSITDNRKGGWYSYRASKAGVNQLAKSTDIYLNIQSGKNALCVSLHPGTVKTDLSKGFWDSTPKGDLLDPAFAAESLVKVCEGMGQDHRGKCWDWNGKEILP